MRKRLEAALAATVLTLSTVAVASPAKATTQPRPGLTLKAVHKRINAGNAPRFTYSTTHVPRGAYIVLQRQFGTGHVWKTVRTETSRSGDVTAPKLPQLGNYVYRLAVVKDRKYLAKTTNRHVYAYGRVSLMTLCNAAQELDDECDGAQTVQVGSRIFTWTVWLQTSEWPETNQDMSMLATSCRSLSIQWAGQYQTDGVTTYVQVVQQSSDEQHASVPNGSVGSATFQLDGGPFYLNASYTPDPDDDNDRVVATGSASCYTLSGSR